VSEEETVIARIWDGATEARQGDEYRVEQKEGVMGPESVPPRDEARALADELRQVWNGDPWHGPSLRGTLEGITAAEAIRHPIADAHSIWELVLHLTAWTDTLTRRLEGEALDEPVAGDFPAPGTPTAEAWAEALARLENAHGRLTERVARLTPAELGATVTGRDHSARFMVRGGIEHLVYHTGQIALLRKVRPR
jgi:hypothetical protein